MLGVTVDAEAAIEILESRANDLNKLLARIPNHLDPWDSPTTDIDGKSPAAQLWHDLDDVSGIGWVTPGSSSPPNDPD